MNPHLYSETINKAAGLARGDRLSKLYALCDSQKTVSTQKLSILLDDLAESDKLDAIHFRKLANQLRKKG